MLCLTSNYGEDVSVHRTYDGATKALVEHVHQYWEEEKGVGVKMPEDPGDAVYEYFNDNPREDYTIDRVKVME